MASGKRTTYQCWFARTENLLKNEQKIMPSALIRVFNSILCLNQVVILGQISDNCRGSQCVNTVNYS